MPHKYIVEENGNLVIEKWRGEISTKTVLDHARTQFSDPRINKGADKITDSRHASFKLNAADVYELAKLFAVKDNRRLTPRIAILIDTHFAISSLYEKLMKAMGIEVMLFSTFSFDASCQWLGYPPEKIKNLLDSIELEPDSNAPQL